MVETIVKDLIQFRDLGYIVAIGFCYLTAQRRQSPCLYHRQLAKTVNSILKHQTYLTNQIIRVSKAVGAEIESLPDVTELQDDV